MNAKAKDVARDINADFGMVVDTDPNLLEEIKRVDRLRAGGDFNNTLPLCDIRIPEAVIITCPKARQHFVQAKHCRACESFKGITQTTYNDEYVMAWNDKYAISCGCPVDRKCSTVAIEG